MSELDAVLAWLDGGGEGGEALLHRGLDGCAVGGRAAAVPGRSVEVRVPPFGAVQCVEGPRHGRGTPPNVVETDARTWLALVTGRLSWADAEATGSLRASGARSGAVADALPLVSH